MTLADIQNLIRRREYEISNKIREMIEDDRLFTNQDLENCIKTGTGIAKSEKDELNQSVDRKKHTIIGFDTRGQRFYTTGKVIEDHLGRFYFFITAHKAD